MTCRMRLLFILFILFILASSVCGSFVVNVAQSSYQAEENHSVTLEWSFTTKTGHSQKSMTVLCQKFTDVRAFVLLHVQEGVEVPESQDELFAGRVQWDKDALEKGLVRLHVSRLRTADSGLYRCGVYMSYGGNSAKCRLNVTAARDRPKPETKDSPTESPQPESRGLSILSVSLGLAAAVLVLLPTVMLIIMYAVKRKNLIGCVTGMNFPEKQPIRAHRALTGPPPP